MRRNRGRTDGPAPGDDVAGEPPPQLEAGAAEELPADTIISEQEFTTMATKIREVYFAPIPNIAELTDCGIIPQQTNILQHFDPAGHSALFGIISLPEAARTNMGASGQTVQEQKQFLDDMYGEIVRAREQYELALNAQLETAKQEREASAHAAQPTEPGTGGGLAAGTAPAPAEGVQRISNRGWSKADEAIF
jgi:hypothetical protein